MAFKRLKSAAPATPAPAAPVENVPAVPQAAAVQALQAQVDQAKASLAAAGAPVTDLTTAQANVVTLFGNTNASSALSTFLATANSGNSTAAMKFPVVNLVAGNVGGMFAPADWTDGTFGPGSADQLPAGKKAIECVFLGYRIDATAWPMAFDDPAKLPDQKPSYSVAVSANDPATMATMTVACKNYQYTPGKPTAKKPKGKKAFDFATSGAGHVKPTAEIMVYLPNVGISVIRTPQSYNSVERTLGSLANQIDKASGALNPFPCKIRPVTNDEGSNSANPWKIHHMEFDVDATSTGVASWQAYNDWRAKELPNDAEAVSNIREFLNCTDRPVTPMILDGLTKAAKL